jgi:hypothetical protein
MGFPRFFRGPLWLSPTPSKGVRPPATCRPRTTPWRKADGVRLLCHLRSCAAIPATVPPSRALQKYPHQCGNLGRRDVATPATVQLPIPHQQSPRIGVRTTNQTRAPVLLPSKPPRHRSHHDAFQGQDSPGRLSDHRHCAPCRHTTPKACDMTVNRLPLVYKRRRRPSSWERGGIAHSPAFPSSLTLLALCLD